MNKLMTLTWVGIAGLVWAAPAPAPDVTVRDFGPQGVGGYPEIVVTDVTAPARIRLSYATHPNGLGEKGDFWHETRANYMGWQLWLPILPANTDRFDVLEIPKAGTYRAGLAQGLVRYVRIAVEKGSAKVADVRFVNDGIHSEEPVVGAFACSDEKVNGVWQASVRTCQMASIPARTKPITVKGVHTNATLGVTYAFVSDGAKRDRLVWSGDLWWAQRNMYAAFDVRTSPYMPGSIRMLAENHTPEGYTQACPFPESHGPLPAADWGPFASDEFAAWFVPVFRDHVLYTGDMKLAKELYPIARNLVNYLASHTRADGIFEQRLATCKHSCGLAVGGTSLHHRSYMNILLWKTYQDAASLADWTGASAADAAAWRARADQLARTIRTQFWVRERGHLKLSLEEHGKMGFEANALALSCHFFTADEAKAVLPQLKYNGHGKFQALAARGAFEYGAPEKAMELIARHNWYKILSRDWWGLRMTSECMGLTTRGWGDEAHPDTAIAGIFTNYLLGVEPLEPGYRTFRVKPQPTQTVTSAKGTVPTPYGLLQVEWHLKKGQPVVTVNGRRVKSGTPIDAQSLKF